MPFSISAGRPDVFVRETDLSQIIPSIPTSIGAIVGASTRGPVNQRTLVTNTRDFIELFGPPDSTISYMHYSALAALERMNRLYVTRAATTSMLNGGVIINSAATTAGLEGLTAGAAETGVAAGSFPTSASEYDDGIAVVFASSPGDWSDDFKIEIDNVDNTNNLFDIIVHETISNNDVERERWRVSRQRKTDGFGKSYYLEDVINGNSRYIRLQDITTVADTVLPKDSPAVAFSGGVNGSAASTAEISTGWDLYANPEEVDVNILIGGGNISASDKVIVTKMESIARARKDCFCILDAPETVLAPTVISSWKSGAQFNIDSNYAALYAPWIKVYDTYNGKEINVPPSGFVAAAMAYTDYVRDAWYPAAGLNRGRVSSGVLPVIDLTHKYTTGQQDTLYSNQINVIRNFPGGGYVIWGNRTLQSTASALSSIHVRRLLIVIEKAISRALRSAVFELNNTFTRNQVKGQIDGFMDLVRSRNGVYEYLTVVDETNNTPEIIDRNEFHIDLYIKAQRSAEFVQLQVIATRTDANFEELTATGGNF